MNLLRKATCKLEVEIKEDGTKAEFGTGFFVSKNLILTSNHLISSCKGSIFIHKCHNQKKRLTAKIIDTCKACDFALLKLNENFDNEHILELCNSEIIEEEKIQIFGYPKGEQGQDIGENLKGTISMNAEDDSTLVQDIVLNIAGFAPNTEYSAFSGSPVINEYNQVTSVLKYQGVRSLSSVSIKKAIPFLEKNNIIVKPDQLQSFEAYNDDVFSLYPENIKTDCETKAINVISSNKPTDIVNTLEGNLYYPKKDKTVTEIITELRKNKNLNISLWKGWIKILTYVEIIKGDYSNINHIQFNLTEIDVKTLYGDNITFDKKIMIPLKLSFYFTKGKNYFQIARSFLPVKTNQKNNTCSIFNSNDEHYLLQRFTNLDKKKIIQDISGSIGNSFKVEDKINFGSLSLEELSTGIVNSETLEEATSNIEKLFIDAIK